MDDYQRIKQQKEKIEELTATIQMMRTKIECVINELQPSFTALALKNIINDKRYI